MEPSDEEKLNPLATKIVMGASSWGANYGLFNANPTGPQELKQMLELASANGLRQIDTAPGYGKSESLIGLSGVGDLKVYSKFAGQISETSKLGSLTAIQKSLETLRIQKLTGIMFHSSRPLFESTEDALALMRDVKSRGWATQWGVSVYDVDELEKLLNLCEPDFVQLPSSLVDRRFVDSGAVSHLNSAGILVHTRSVFLQGLLLRDAEQVPDRFKKFQAWAQVFEEFAKDLGVSKYHLSLLYNLTNPDVCKVLVGLHSLRHVEALLASLKERTFLPDWRDLPTVQDPQLVDPRSW